MDVDEKRRLRKESEIRELQHWPRPAHTNTIGIGNGLIVYGAYSWWPRVSVIERQPGVPARSYVKELPEFPKISKDYVWQPMPWEPDSQTKDEWIASPSVSESVAFCPECGGFIRSDEHGEAICVACGLVGATPRLDYNGEKARIAEAISDEKAFHRTHTHKPSVKQNLNSAKVDRRVENIVLSLDDYDPAIEIFGGKYFIKMSKLLDRYNNAPAGYAPITRFQLRDSLEERIVDRSGAKIDRLIEKMLFRTFHPIDDKIIVATFFYKILLHGIAENKFIRMIPQV